MHSALLPGLPLTVLLASCAALAPSAQQVPVGSPPPPPLALEMRLGAREPRGDSWQGLDTQGVMGGTLVYTPPEWPVALEGGLTFAWDDGYVNGIDRESWTTEFSFGIRKSFPLASTLDLVVGGGVFWAYTSEYQDEDDCWCLGDEIGSDGWMGGYVHTALYAHLSEQFHIGFDARFADGSDPTIGLDERSGSYEEYTLVGRIVF